MSIGELVQNSAAKERTGEKPLKTVGKQIEAGFPSLKQGVNETGCREANQGKPTDRIFSAILGYSRKKGVKTFGNETGEWSFCWWSVIDRRDRKTANGKLFAH